MEREGTKIVRESSSQLSELVKTFIPPLSISQVIDKQTDRQGVNSIFA